MRPMKIPILAYLCLLVFPLLAQGESTAPYFVILDQTGQNEPATEALPLKSTDVAVNLAGVIADVEVRQLYQNTGKTTLECLYVFPGSTRAAVHGMEFTIGDRKIVAQIEEKQKALEQYEQAKAENRTAALLDQERPNVFQMRVGHILPGDEIEVTLRYTEHVIATDRIYEFVFPTVVGPRYVGQSSRTSDGQWIANPFLTEGSESQTRFDISVNVNSGLPIKDLSCDTHPVRIAYQSNAKASLKLKQRSEDTGDRDFILRYRLAGETIDSGLITYRDEALGENFFLLTIQPPERVATAAIPPRDYVFVVDVSGSMSGFPLETSKELLRDLIGSLKPTDTFNVLFFAGSAHTLSNQPLAANAANITKALQMLDNQRGGGGTELLPALERALDLENPGDTSRSIVIVTDGYVTVERETFEVIRNGLNQANVFAFGIGSSVNRYLIEGMARAGQGEPFIVTDKADASRESQRLRKLLASPVLTGIEIEFDRGFDAYDIEPSAYPDVFADRPLVVFGKFRGDPGGMARVTGKSGEENVDLSVPIETAESSNIALPKLWARSRIATLSDYLSQSEDRDEIAEVTHLGLTYGLLTRYTSFIGIDTRVRKADNLESQTVKQPLPLPTGVPTQAVGGGAIPEPSSALLLIVVALVLIFQRRRREVEA